MVSKMGNTAPFPLGVLGRFSGVGDGEGKETGKGEEGIRTTELKTFFFKRLRRVLRA